MKKVKYFYNTHTLRYEKLVTPLRVKLLRFFGIISALVVSSAIVIYLYNRFIPKPTELEANRRFENLRDNYKILNTKVRTLQEQLSTLEKRDNEVYRSIFEQNPLPDSARAKLIEKQKELNKVAVMSDDILGKDIAAQLNNLDARITYQTTSYKGIENLIKNQDAKLASIPAIQPLSNKQLTRIASGFGMRIHPIYGIAKMHNGLDFTAPQGTPIYATGDGQVTTAGLGTGTGNHVTINHGYGYETEYMHMVRIKARQGQRVKRDDRLRKNFFVQIASVQSPGKRRILRVVANCGSPVMTSSSAFSIIRSTSGRLRSSRVAAALRHASSAFWASTVVPPARPSWGE